MRRNGSETGSETQIPAPAEMPSESVDVSNAIVAGPHRKNPHLPHTGGIALALGGGVAKGWAHIGVMRAFEEAKIPISMIAGTSIGALVGGCYLAGKLDALEDFARSLTWTGVLRFMDFTFSGAGLISGMRLAARMAEHLDGATIESLPAPFVSVCTDIRSGHEIWLHDGPMISAIRASYALPGVFAPVEHNGRMLVDGALVNPVPVSACRAYEPDIVIAVNLNGEAFGRNTVIRSSHYDNRAAQSAAQPSAWSAFLSAVDHHGVGEPAAPSQVRRNPRMPARLGMSGVMIEAFTIIQDRIERARLAGDPPDFVIRPRLGKIGLSEFHRAAESIDLGHAEAAKRIGELADSGLLETIR
jgi:NTE family protein